ncbi:MAG: hypothetical protein M1504_02615 [Candidatus Marsarchaeota archaeon]|nr:hypothetical protein [Candidatus Marsarchaeota archaeon]
MSADAKRNRIPYSDKVDGGVVKEVEVPVIARAEASRKIQGLFNGNAILVGKWAANFYCSRNVGPLEMEFVVRGEDIGTEARSLPRQNIAGLNEKVQGISVNVAYQNEQRPSYFGIPIDRIFKNSMNVDMRVGGEVFKSRIASVPDMVIIGYNKMKLRGGYMTDPESIAIISDIMDTIYDQFANMESFLERKEVKELYIEYESQGWILDGFDKFKQSLMTWDSFIKKETRSTSQRNV